MTKSTSTLVVIEASGDAQLLGRCLEGVLGGLSTSDRTVIVSSEPERVKRVAAGRRNVELQPHPGAELGACLAGWAEQAERVVLLSDDAIIAQRNWLTALNAVARANPATVIGVATNAAPWPQAPSDVPDASAPRRDVRETAQRCAHEHKGATLPVARIAGPLVLVDRSSAAPLVASKAASLRQVQADLMASGVAHLVAQDVYVHASTGVPLVSGCLIVKDEEADIAACLESIAPVVDELIVYDTGSSDGTVAIAQSFGATVITGAWHNDFARARNAAMDAARGTWVLSIDADERLEVDPGAAQNLRELLRTNPPVDRYIIALYDLLGSVHAPVRGESGKPMARLFRRRRCQWIGAIHEQPDARPGTPAARSEWIEGIRYLHHGYLDEIVAEKGKWARNLRVAANNLEKVPEDSKGCFDLGRSMQSMGYRTEALNLFERAAELGDNPVITRAALQFEIQTLLELGLHDDVEAALERLERASETPNVARYLQGWLRVEQGRWADVLACMDGLTDYNDTFTSYTEDRRLGALALALRGLGRREEAAHAAARALGSNPQSNQGWTVLFDTEDAVPGLLVDVAGGVPQDRLLPTFVTLGKLPLSARDRFADALVQARPGDLTALAMASQFAADLGAQRLAVWSARLRSAGLVSLCPLAKIAGDGNRTVDDRALVLATALHHLRADELDADDVAVSLERLIGLLVDDAVAPLAETVLTDLIGAAENVIVAAATTAPRATALIGPLASHGHLSEALAVLDHASGLDLALTQRWARDHGDVAAQLHRAAGQLGRDDLYPVLQHAA